LREYINFREGSNLQPISFVELVTNYKNYDETLPQIPKIKGLFRDYLQHGYYPFWFEDENTFYERLLTIIDKTVFEDIASFYNLKTNNLNYFKKLLNFLASIPPGEVNTHSLARNLGIDNKTTLHYLQILKATGLVKLLYPFGKGNNLLRKPEKILLDNTTLLFALHSLLGDNFEVGTMRELFFIQSLIDAGINVFYSEIGDYQTKEYIFEIGGKNKKAQQIKTAKLPAVLVKDDILVSSGNAIPLYYFGFLY
jgi:uncharacterized protein